MYIKTRVDQRRLLIAGHNYASSFDFNYRRRINQTHSPYSLALNSLHVIGWYCRRRLLSIHGHPTPATRRNEMPTIRAFHNEICDRLTALWEPAGGWWSPFRKSIFRILACKWPPHQCHTAACGDSIRITTSAQDGYANQPPPNRPLRTRHKCLAYAKLIVFCVIIIVASPMKKLRAQQTERRKKELTTSLLCATLSGV